MAGADSEAGARIGGLLNSIKQLVATVVAIVQTRLELLGVEVHAESRRLIEIVVLSAAALFFLGSSILLLTALVIVALWDSNRLLVMGGFTVLYLAIGIALAMGVRRRTAAGSNLFQSSLAELEKDRQRLSA